MSKNTFQAPASRRAGAIAMLLWVFAAIFPVVTGFGMGIPEMLLEVLLIVTAVHVSRRASRVRRA